MPTHPDPPPFDPHHPTPQAPLGQRTDDTLDAETDADLDAWVDRMLNQVIDCCMVATNAEVVAELRRIADLLEADLI